MEYMVKVTVIMPSLNVADYVGMALQSVCSQTLPEIEIICIDAGSTDGTWEIVQEHAARDKRINAIKSPVQSYGFQVNRALDMAHGKYAAVLETDDYVAADMYEVLFEEAERLRLDYIKCDYDAYSIDGNGREIYVTRRLSTDPSCYDRVLTPRQCPETVFDDWYLWNGIYRLDFIRDHGIRFSETPGAAFQDIGFLHRTAAAAERVLFLGKSLYRYCVGRSGASSHSDRQLAFIRGEYGLLLNAVGDYASAEEKRLLYLRMARSFVLACANSSDGALSGMESAKICKWFVRHLGEAERWSYISETDMPESLRKGYRNLMNPAEGFISYRNVGQNELLLFLGQGNPVVIFGCGMFGREALRYVTKLGYKVDAFMDNDSRLWGSSIGGVRVEEPGKAVEMPKLTRYVIANERYAAEICEQLERYVDEPHTFLYIPAYRGQ